MSASAARTVVFFYRRHDISIKGKERFQFEKILTANLTLQLKDAGVTLQKTAKLVGRELLIALESDTAIIEAVLPRVFGIANWGKYESCPRELPILKARICEHFASRLADGHIASFNIETTRVDKRFLLTAPFVSREVGAAIGDAFGVPVDVERPAITLYIEVLADQFAYASTKREGALGLPIGMSGPVAMLISGGLRSPVASWMMMRGGCAVTYLHFHSAPYGEWRSSISKIRKIVRYLMLWGGPPKFYAIGIGDSQQKIALETNGQMRIALYRCLMMRVAKRIAEQTDCCALATGESLGESASQTIESMKTLQTVVDSMLILRPLLGFCKEEIDAKAKLIGTDEISALRGGDCCSDFLPKSMVKMRHTRAVRGKLDMQEMVEAALRAARLIDVNEPWDEDCDEKGLASRVEFEG
jgi:thiamine biosynthesis protein ThiI